MRRRGSAVALLALIERLLTPATAFALFESRLALKTASSMALGVVFIARGVTQRLSLARTEAELYDRVAEGVLGGDVLCANVLPDEDARVELLQGVYFVSALLAQELPLFVADAVASGVLAVAVVLLVPGRIVAAAALTMLVGAAASVWFRRRYEAAFVDRGLRAIIWSTRSSMSWKGGWRLSRQARARSFGRTLRVWRGRGSARTASALVAGVTGRLLFVVAAVVVAVALIDASVRGAQSITPADIAVLASVAPAFSGLGQGLNVHARLRAGCGWSRKS